MRASPRAHTSFPGFSATVAALAAFHMRLKVVDDRVLAERERIVERYLDSQGPLQTAYDPVLHGVCEATLREVEQCESVTVLGTLPSFLEFEQAFPVPPKLIQQANLAAIQRFIEARARATSETTAMERAASKARDEARRAADQSAEVLAAKAAAELSRQEAIANCCGWLALSDHLPIRVVATVAGGRTVRVSSHNVQEHVRDGLGTYVASLPFVANTSGAVSQLVSAMMAPEVLARQAADVIGFVQEELGGGSDAICLQEVTLPLLGSLRAAAGERCWSVHACGAEALALSLPEGACGALTCVVTAAAAAAAAAADVVVEVQEKTKVNRRQFAAVRLPGGAHVVSTHVRHPKGGSFSEQQSNADSIRAANEVWT